MEVQLMDTIDDDRPEAPRRNYRVGKGKPDKSKSWKPGQSGNRKGRPKGSKNLKNIARAAAKRLVTISRNGRKQKQTYLEVGIEQLQRAVAQGSRGALRDYLAFLERHLDPNETKLSMNDLTAQDQALLDYVFSRAKLIRKQGTKS
jgi:hypothetical protein